MGVNAMFLVLIPKKEGALGLSDFRPFGMVSSLYKIITKVLSLPLRTAMDKITFSSQGVFVKGRQIMGDIFIANECVDKLKKMEKSGIVCKIDLENAYDRVDWDILRWVVKKEGFGDKWISWLLGWKGCKRRWLVGKKYTSPWEEG